jgi:hypothetical protein
LALGSRVSFYFSFKLEFLSLNGPVPMVNKWAAKRERCQCTTVAISGCSRYRPFCIQPHIFSLLLIVYFHIFLVPKFMFKCDDFHFLKSLTFCIFNRAFVKIRKLRQLTVYRQVQTAVQHFHAVQHWQSRKKGKNSTARHFKFGPLKLYKCWYIQLVWFISGQYMTRYCDLNNLLQDHSIPWIT